MPREDGQFTSANAAEMAARRTNPGRRPKIYNILKDKGYGKEDILASFEEIAFYDEAELAEVMDDTTKPILVRILAKNMQQAYEKGSFLDIRSIMEHITGKPQEKVEHSGEVGRPTLQCTPEQKAFIEPDE